MSRFILIASLLVFPGIAKTSDFSTVSSGALARWVDNVRHPDCDCELVIEITEKRPAGRVEKSTYRAFLQRKKGEAGYNVLLLCESPSRMAGRMMLFRGNRIWYRLPNWKKPMQLPAAILGRRAFLAAVFQVSFEKHYQVEEREEEVIRDDNDERRKCRKLVMTDPEPAFRFFPGRAEYWIDSRTGEFVRGDYYGRNGKLLRVVHYGGNQFVLGEWRPMDSSIRHVRFGGIETRVHIVSFRRTDLPDSWMDPENMKCLLWNPDEDRFEITCGRDTQKARP